MPPVAQVTVSKNCISIPYPILFTAIAAIISLSVALTANIYTIKSDISDIKEGIAIERKMKLAIIKECCTDTAAKNLMNFDF